MPPRFYVPEARAEESTIELPEDEAAHLTRVLRMAAGSHIRIFNGRGDEWEARVEDVAKRRVTVRLVNRVVPRPEASVAITLAVAVLKGEKFDDIIRDAVMLGVATIEPIITTRTEVAIQSIEKSARISRWQRIAVASAKQCGRAVVPDVRPARLFDEAIASMSGTAATSGTNGLNATVMLVEPSAGQQVLTLRELPRRDHLAVLVGPEGGWTEQEVRRARETGAMLLTLGTQTLRADAVPIVALTALRVRLEDF